MSHTLLCDVCGTVESPDTAPRNGWITVDAMADLHAAVPPVHPLHHARHLCSIDCFGAFAQAVTEGLMLHEPAPRPLSSPVLSALDAGRDGHADDEPLGAGGGPRRPPRQRARQRRPAAGRPRRVRNRTPVADGEVPPAPQRLSEVLADRGGGDGVVDLRLIAKKAPPRRRG